MATPGMVEILFGSYRRKALALLLLRADESFHVREISRLAGVPAGSMHRELKLLANAGLLVRDSVGNQVRYRANRDCPIFEELAAIFRKTSGLADVLKEALAPLVDEIDFAFVFGSVAQGKEKAQSDIDLLVVGSVAFVSVVQALASTHECLGRDVNPAVMTCEYFRQKLGTDSFIRRITEESKLFIIGSDHDFRKFAEHRPTEDP